jgi:dTDP-4-dehydrorhamnose 3,5-epimerase-like enzyme
MAKIITLTTFLQQRGNLTVIEKILPFEIKRIFYIYHVDDSVRGKHRHHKTRQAAICINGSCTIYSTNGTKEETFLMNDPAKCLLVEPEDWHSMYDFSKDAVLLVLASEYFNPDDYIYEEYKK